MILPSCDKVGILQKNNEISDSKYVFIVKIMPERIEMAVFRISRPRRGISTQSAQNALRAL